MEKKTFTEDYIDNALNMPITTVQKCLEKIKAISVDNILFTQDTNVTPFKSILEAVEQLKQLAVIDEAFLNEHWSELKDFDTYGDFKDYVTECLLNTDIQDNE